MGVVTDPAILRALNGDAAPAAQDAGGGFPGVIAGRPDPMKAQTAANDVTRTGIAVAKEGRDAATDSVNLQIKQGELQDRQRKEEMRIGAQKDSVSKLANVIDNIDAAAIQSASTNGWFKTGLTGAMTSWIPGTGAHDLSQRISTVGANAAFESLQKMRDASPTGGALGQVSEGEEKLLRDAVAALDTTQSEPQFLQQLAVAKKHFLETLGRLDPQAAAAYNNKPGIRFDDKGNPTLYSTAGEDNRQPIDPFGVNSGGNPPPADGGGNPPPSGGDGGGMGSIATGMGQGVNSTIKGLATIPGIIVNPVGQALYNATGHGDRKYDLGQILADAVGAPNNPNKVSDAAVQTAAGAFGGGALARGAASVVASPIARNALSMLGRAPVSDAAAGAGAGGGAQFVKQNGGGPVAQGAALVAGGLLANGGVNALARSAAPKSANALAQAAGRQGVDLLPADTGGMVTKGFTSAAKSSPMSVAPIKAAGQRSVDQFGQAITRTAGTQGQQVTTDLAGQGVRDAAQRFTKETSARGSQLYDRAYEAAKGVRIKPLQTMQKLDAEIARMAENPAVDQAGLNELKGLRDKIASGVSVQGLRDARTELSQGVYSGKLRSGADQARWQRVLDNISSDIDMGLRSAGRQGAANQFKKADAFWKARVEHLDEVLQPILGNNGTKSGEDVVKAVESMAQGASGGNARLSRLLANMQPQEAGNIRAMLIERIGKATPGAQTAEGQAFAPSTFLTNWNKMTPQGKASLFSETGLRKNLDDLALIAENMKAAQAVANHSGTTFAATANAGGILALGAAHPALALLGGGTQYLTGKLLASPRFASMLARSAKMPPEAAQRSMIQQLGVIATREPLIRADAQGVMQYLASQAAKSPGRAAAEDTPDRRRIPPQQ